MPIPPLAAFPAIVIGGGISGLACAYRLSQAGISVRLLDAGDSPGGVIATVERAGFRFELGPQSFLSSESLLALIRDLGLDDELLRADPSAPRYILYRGKLVQAPLAPPSLLTTSLLGFPTKWRIFNELLRRTQPPASDESIASFVRRKFGDELLDRLVAPFVSGIYAGDPERLSLRAAFPKLHEFEMKYGSVLRGAMKSRPPKDAPRAGLCSFRAGMEALPRALTERLGDAFMTETTVTAARLRPSSEKNGNSGFEVDVIRNDGRETILASALIMATPTHAASEILKGVSEQFAEKFARIEYAPLAVVAAGYRRDQIAHSGNGFGFLVPRSEGLRVLGTVWNSSLFPGRAPEGMACFTSFVGGANDPAVCNLSDDEIAETVCGEVGRILGITGPPVSRVVHRYARALPQYNLGHSETIAALGRLTAAVPGLFLAGNYLYGPSLGSCVEQAFRTADATHIYLTSIGAATPAIAAPARIPSGIPGS